MWWWGCAAVMTWFAADHLHDYRKSGRRFDLFFGIWAVAGIGLALARAYQP